MTSLSISLSDDLAKASQKAASQLGMSRTSFIRLAIQHELDAFVRREEQAQIAQALRSLQTNPAYLKEIQDLDNADFPPLPDEGDEWWKS